MPDEQRSQVFREALRGRPLIKPGESHTVQFEGFDVAEGGGDICEGVRRDPLRPKLGEVQAADVVARYTRGSSVAGLEAGGGVQLDVGEEVVAAPVSPAFRNEGTRAQGLLLSSEHVNYVIDHLLGDMRCHHFESGGAPGVVEDSRLYALARTCGATETVIRPERLM